MHNFLQAKPANCHLSVFKIQLTPCIQTKTAILCGKKLDICKYMAKPNIVNNWSSVYIKHRFYTEVTLDASKITFDLTGKCHAVRCIIKYIFFNSVLRPFQDYFSSYETGQSVGGAKTGEPREKPPDTPTSRTWLASHVAKEGLEPTPVTAVR